MDQDDTIPPPPACTGPFVDARDCPVHDPRKPPEAPPPLVGIPGGRVDEDVRAALRRRASAPNPYGAAVADYQRQHHGLGDPADVALHLRRMELESELRTWDMWIAAAVGTLAPSATVENARRLARGAVELVDALIEVRRERARQEPTR